MYWSCMSFRTTFFRIKWSSTSMFLVLPWNIEFITSWIAYWLSHHKDGGLLLNNHKSRSCYRIQYKYVVVSANALYSTSVELRDIVFCFLATHDIGLLPKNITKAVVEHMSREFPAQSELEKAFRLNSFADFQSRIPLEMIPQMYLSTRLPAWRWQSAGELW